MKSFSLLMMALLTAPMARAEIKTDTIDYKDGDTVLEGKLVYDDAVKSARDGVIIFHEWSGPGAYEQSRAEQIAKLGYVAFVADIYGKGVRPKTFEECKAESAKYHTDRDLMLSRAKAALDTLKTQRQVFQHKFVAIGYCFGGMPALDLARSGAKLAGVVTFHGALDTPNPVEAQHITCPILVLHGADDPFVTYDQVQAFASEMDAAKVDYKIIKYPGAVHRFTNPASGTNVASGIAYNEEADHKSWAEFEAFLKKVFD